MRANIPKNPPTQASSELNGIYLQAMQEISAHLMDALPAGDTLWQTLGQAEAMLLEAQAQGMPLRKLFGQGGVASFCQSIVDEYRAEHPQQEAFIPASQDPTVGESRRQKEPRGGRSYRRKKNYTIALASLAVLLVVSLLLWYVGLFRYWTGGSSYYLSELHNFEETVTTVSDSPIRFQIPLQKAYGLEQVLYDDGTYRMTLHEVDYNEYMKAYRNEETGKTEYKKARSWYFSVIYSVSANFRTVTYVEPSANGAVRITLPDGSVTEGELSWLNSGEYDDGREIMRFILVESPEETDLTGATAEVDLGCPNLVQLKRISTGHR